MGGVELLVKKKRAPEGFQSGHRRIWGLRKRMGFPKELSCQKYLGWNFNLTQFAKSAILLAEVTQ